MRTEALDYALPPELIAQRPCARRGDARLLVVRSEALGHRHAHELPDLLPEGALLVVNDTRVIRARLVGRRSTGGRAEILLLERQSTPGAIERWAAIGKASKRIAPGTIIDADGIGVTVLERSDGGALTVEVRAPGGVGPALETMGRVPLPPYVRRDPEAADVDRYQTVWAEHDGSVAAPTAGLHFSKEALDRCERRRVTIGKVTLHVGEGTFRPITTAEVAQHPMHAERYVVSERLASQVAEARERGGPVVAIGTTVVRALESAADDRGGVAAQAGKTSLFIKPGYRFRVVDSLVTNFHVPRSSLLALVAAFAGLERLMSAYAVAIAEGYRFLSYGDAMWIPERAE